MREPTRDAFTDWTGAGYEPGHGDRRMEAAFTPGPKRLPRGRTPHHEDEAEARAEARMEARDDGRSEW